MSISCKLGFHNWIGCQCSNCGHFRNKEHDYRHDCNICARCGKTRPDAHDWNGCKCIKCYKIRDQNHDWRDDCNECARCGKTRPDAHKWKGCKCTKCGQIRDQDHNWSLNCEVCAKCDETRGRDGAHHLDGYKCTLCQISLISAKHVKYFKEITPEVINNQNQVWEDLSIIGCSYKPLAIGLEWIPSFVYVIENSNLDHATLLAGAFSKIRNALLPTEFFVYMSSPISEGGIGWLGCDLFNLALNWLSNNNPNVSNVAIKLFQYLERGVKQLPHAVDHLDLEALNRHDVSIVERWGRAAHILPET